MNFFLKNSEDPREKNSLSSLSCNDNAGGFSVFKSFPVYKWSIFVGFCKADNLFWPTFGQNRKNFTEWDIWDGLFLCPRLFGQLHQHLCGLSGAECYQWARDGNGEYGNVQSVRSRIKVPSKIWYSDWGLSNRMDNFGIFKNCNVSLDVPWGEKIQYIHTRIHTVFIRKISKEEICFFSLLSSTRLLRNSFEKFTVCWERYFYQIAKLRAT